MSIIRTTQPKRTLNLSRTTIRVLSSPELHWIWCAGDPPPTGYKKTANLTTPCGGGTTPASAHPHHDCPTQNCRPENDPSPPNPAPGRRGDGAA
jgi:hypothetical protein